MKKENLKGLVRRERAYTLHYEAEDGGIGERDITVPAGTEDEQDAAAWDAAEEAAAAWIREGEWGDEGAIVWARYWWEDADYDTSDYARTDDIEIEPNHDRLIAAAGGDTDCDHDWTSDGEGGLAENPGVWSRGGTTMQYADHCRRCGLHRVETCYGPQRNPGQSDKTEYRQMDDEEIAAHRANGTMDAPDEWDGDAWAMD